MTKVNNWEQENNAFYIGKMFSFFLVCINERLFQFYDVGVVKIGKDELSRENIADE